jgi:hypothetical protein
VAQKPLSPKQHQAADLIGAGHTYTESAGAVGVAPRTVRRWMRREDFRALVKQRRGAELDANPTARATLEAALLAAHSNGKPDWRTRVSAARALIGADSGGDDEPPVRETTIHTHNLDQDGEGE